MPIRVDYIPGKGRGIFAKKTFTTGEPIFSETPFIAAPSDCWVQDLQIKFISYFAVISLPMLFVGF
jgi:hypothetical protein